MCAPDRAEVAIGVHVTAVSLSAGVIMRVTRSTLGRGNNQQRISVMHHDPNEQSQADLDNHANQLNPNNDEYWNSRGEERPDDDED